MTDATRPLQAAIYTRLVSALTTAGYSSPSTRVLQNPRPSDALPYLVFTGSTAIDFGNHTNDGQELAVSLTAWAETPGAADALIETAVDALLDRTDPITVSGFTLADYRLDFRGSMLFEQTGPDEYYGVPLRIRYRVIEP